MTNENLTPKIRFKGFTDPWEQRKAREIFISRTEKNHADQPVLSVTQDNGIVLRKDIDIDIKYDKSTLKNYKLVRPSEFVISLRSFQGGFELAEIQGIVSPAYTIFAFDEAHYYDITFWKYLFKTFSFIESLKKVTYGIRDGKSISFNEFSSLKLVYPIKKNEQANIGGLLDEIADLIAANEDKLKHLQELKKLLMQKIFSQEWRFKGFTDPWEQRKLNQIVSKSTEKNSKNQFEETLTNSAVYGIVKQNDYFDRKVSGKDTSNYYVVKPDYFVYNPRISVSAPFGPIRKNKLGITGVMSPLYIVFKLAGEKIKSEFLETFFKSTNWYKFMYQNGDSGARSDRFAIKDKLFFKMPILIPSVDEQQKIGKIIDALSNLIAANEDKLNQLKQVKKFLMQNMFV
ncbi:restriction endonuclease subunit S [Lactiplantibacillus modestisalitolerans]|uniref:Restriction endonuclease subunit S n=1 Tax=Lactiplantibacillus modestisalitolerans TaxID=1457219 RepID=A0ABV5WUY5_9LACO|nr:restriction endonuclease subunit S [Lactiplantibacillus modestisalitolerans]